jgi:DNA-binding transcriptional ArsR family regulator
VEAVQIFKALGDPVRLEIVKRLSNGSSYTMNNLSKDLGVSRQGARKQIQVLLSAKIVNLSPVGRETLVSLDLSSLELARTFISNIEEQWDQRLNALKNFVEK